MSRGSTPQPNFAILFGLACVLVGVQVMAQFWAATAVTLPDTDDALRLVQVRSFLSGQGWFDLHQARFDPPAGYDSHWSRLIDAGLAGLFIAFRTFVDPALAERLMLALWPGLWLIPMIGATAAIGGRLGGREAACAARRVLARTSADYLVTCGAQGPLGLSEAETARSLWGHLHSGDVPDWLAPVADLQGQPFAVYRVKR